MYMEKLADKIVAAEVVPRKSAHVWLANALTERLVEELPQLIVKSRWLTGKKNAKGEDEVIT